MPEGLLIVIGLLSLGYVLLLLEIFVPGGVLGILGILGVVYGCYVAFGLGPSWGFAAVGLSAVLTFIGVRVFIRSRTAKKMVLDVPEAREWKANDESLGNLIGKSGRTLTPLRPAGLAEIDEERIDVVADNEFIDADVAIRVFEVEGNRVVVEAIDAAETATL